MRPDTPYHSIIRLFKKKEEFNFNTSIEFESSYISTLLKIVDFKKNKEYGEKNKNIQKKFPNFNSSIDDIENGKMTIKKYYHIGIAVDTPHGLMVPKLRNTENKNINLDRSYMIVKLLEKDYEWNNAILFSNYYTNFKYHGCIYDDKIMSIIKHF